MPSPHSSIRCHFHSSSKIGTTDTLCVLLLNRPFPFCLLNAKFFLWSVVFFHVLSRSNYHVKNFALRLALKRRQTWTPKWTIWFIAGGKNISTGSHWRTSLILCLSIVLQQQETCEQNCDDYDGHFIFLLPFYEFIRRSVFQRISSLPSSCCILWNLSEWVFRITCVTVSFAWPVNSASCFICWICPLVKLARYAEALRTWLEPRSHRTIVISLVASTNCVLPS